MNHDMPFGATLLDSGGVRFRLWAPGAASIKLQLHDNGQARALPMQAQPGGWHECTEEDAHAGTRYDFMLPDGLVVPDPASRFNPEDPSRPSEVIDPQAYAWSDGQWHGRPWHEAIVYELHVGAFTPEGTYAAAIDRLDDLAALGITAIELMPLADFPGKRGWGYDGVLPFAPDASYGRPEELKHFIDEAHARRLMVLVDVVYNHFGPQGNFLHAYSPGFFNAAHQTPWGAAINFDGPGSRTVRDFFVHNALYWVEEFHADGLRLDAVHAIRDDSRLHIVREIAHAMHEGPGRERAVHLVLENDANQATLLDRNAPGGSSHADAQWNDDWHHAAHVLTTGESDGYYAGYADAPLQRLGRALAEGFAYQGEAFALREGHARGEPSAHLPGTAFVDFLQNHDQIGNRALGQRLDALADTPQKAQRLHSLYAVLLLTPHIPMFFMGEEFAASTPFLYFCDFEGDLAQAVSRGRRDEFKRFAAFADPAARERIPDPVAESSFLASKLDWRERAGSRGMRRLAWIEHLLKLRCDWLMPRLAGMRGGVHTIDDGLLELQWPLGDGSTWHMAINLSTRPRALPTPRGAPVLLHRADAQDLLPDGVRVALEDPRG